MAGFPSQKKGNQKGEKAITPRPGVPLDKDQLIDLITRTHGNLSRVADALGCTRYAVRRRCDADPELKQALEDARERIIDELEKSCWDDAIENRDTALRCFLLKTQAKHRGYEQSEAQHAAKDIATAAFDFILNKSKNPAEPSK
jgi:thiamine pyrophosphate-dependent acetolactate synthase large subunit-like protein